MFCILVILYRLGVKYRFNDMKGIKDVWNMCIIKCIANERLIGIILIKGDNSRIANEKLIGIILIKGDNSRHN